MKPRSAGHLHVSHLINTWPNHRRKSMHLKSSRVTKQLRNRTTGRHDLSPISAKSFLPIFLPSLVVGFGMLAMILHTVIVREPTVVYWHEVGLLTLFGPITLYCLWMVFDRKPFLIMDETGIQDRSQGLQKTPWNEFTSAKLTSARGISYLELEPSYPDQWVSQRLSPIRQFFAKITGVKTCYIALSCFENDPVVLYKYVITKVPGGWL